MLKSAFIKIATGLLIGMGFALAVVGVFLGFGAFQSEEVLENISHNYTTEAGLIIESHRVQPRSNGAVIVGTVRNNGTSNWHYISFVVEQFDAKGDFIDKCEERDTRSIAPGATLNFKISCETPCGKLAGEFASYRVAIDDAMFKREAE